MPRPVARPGRAGFDQWLVEALFAVGVTLIVAVGIASDLGRTDRSPAPTFSPWDSVSWY